MQDKKTVVFIVPDKPEQATAIKNVLIKDVLFAGVIISEAQLRCSWKNHLFDKLFRKGTVVGDRVRKLSGKKKKEFFSYGEWCGFPDKTVRNMIYRYNPECIVVSSPEALSACIYAVKKNGLHNKICVLADGFFVNEHMIDGAVDCYFIDNIGMRKKLLEAGISAEQIEINPLALTGEYLAPKATEKAREAMGYREEPVVVFDVEGGGAKVRRTLHTYLSQPKGSDYSRLFICGEDGYMKSFLEEKEVPVLDDMNKKADALNAADIVVTVPNAVSVKQALALKKRVIVFAMDGEMRENYDYTVSHLPVAGADDGKSLLAELERALVFVPEERQPATVPDSATVVARRLKEMLLQSKD